MTRRGYSIAELLVALVIAGIIGISLSNLVINQARFVGLQQGMMAARSGARAGLNVMVQELHMITAGGVIDAGADSITVLVPYAFGLACTQPSGGWQAVGLLPVDSAVYASVTLPSGYAWRDSLATWRYVTPATSIQAGPATDCSLASPPIAVLPGGKIVEIKPNVLALSTYPRAVPIYLYQRIRYAFAASAQLTGRRALWRTIVSTGQRDELVAPFDTSSRFSFLTGNALTASATPPAVLDSLRGVKVRLVGQSEDPPEGRTKVSNFDLTTNIVFVNRAP